jgi:hypothetical protein
MDESTRASSRVGNLEVTGEVILAILESTRSLGDEALRILGRHHITAPAAGQWYPLPHLLDAFAEMEASLSKTTLFTIGHKIHRNAVLPASYEDFVQALEGIDEAYHLNHRGGAIGHYGFERVAKRHVEVLSTSLYPCEFDRGVVHGFASMARPADIQDVTVQHDKNGPCRRLGGPHCIYHVTW